MQATSRSSSTPPRNPADRILIATARELAATLVTRDREIIAYGQQGNVSVLLDDQRAKSRARILTSINA